MTVSRSTMVQRIRYHLGDMPWETTGSALNGTSVISVADGTEWQKGTWGEFEDNGDTFWVRSVSGDDLTCTRSYFGSTGTAHSAGSRIFREPRHKYGEIVNAIAAAINYALPWPRAYKIVADTVTPDPNETVWYDLASDALGLVNVTQQRGTDDVALHTYGERHMPSRVVLARNLPATLVASGVGVAFPDGFVHESNTVYINYAAKITTAGDNTVYTDITEGDSVVEAIIFKAVSILEASTELRRPRQPTDDNPLRGSSVFEAMYHTALANTEKELRLRYPLMT